MSKSKLPARHQKALDRLQRQYGETRAELVGVGFILQGSLTERWVQCGKAACRCHQDSEARHGPYYQLSWKSGGRTSSVYLTWEQAELCREWARNHRHMERTLKRLREISRRVARLYEIRSK